ncbi:putative pyridoxal kinase [Umbelopsis sp. WA50703]
MLMAMISFNYCTVCDPVMGDDGSLYVSPEVLPLYRELICMADIVTPNQTEAEALVDMKIENLKDAQKVIQGLHNLGAAHVIITSVHLPREDLPSQLTNGSDMDKIMVCIGSSRHTFNHDPEGKPKQFLISFPSYRGYFTGTGDMFSALMVARFTEQEQAADANNDDNLSALAKATFKSMLTLNAVTEKTWKRQKEYVKSQEGDNAADIEGKPESAQTVHHCELMVVQGKQAIEDPDSFDKGQVKIVAI